MHALQQNKDLGSASDLLNIGFNPSESLITTQICVWAVTHHHYRISALDIQTLFCGEIPITHPPLFSLFLAFPLANWSVSFDNATATSIRFSWQNLQSLIGLQLSHYFIVVKDSYGSRLNEYIVSGNTTSHVLSGLSAWREYRLSIVGVNYRGNAYNSTEITAWTDEGGMCIMLQTNYF